MSVDQPQPNIIHASCVTLGGRGLLIKGPSGSGKSALALQLMAFGAMLVADDRVVVKVRNGEVFASAPPTLKGLIEARGIGLLNADAASESVVVGVVDLAHLEEKRLPEHSKVTIDGYDIPLFYAVNEPRLTASLLQFLKAGRSDR